MGARSPALDRAGPTLPRRAEHDGPAAARRSDAVRAARPARARRRDAESNSISAMARRSQAGPALRPGACWSARVVASARVAAARNRYGRYRRGRNQHERCHHGQYQTGAWVRHGMDVGIAHRRAAHRHCSATESARPARTVRKQGALRRRTPVTLLAFDRAYRARTAGNPAKHLHHPAQFLDRRREPDQKETARRWRPCPKSGAPTPNAVSRIGTPNADHEHAGAQRHDAEDQQEIEHTGPLTRPRRTSAEDRAESSQDVLKKVRICL